MPRLMGRAAAWFGLCCLPAVLCHHPCDLEGMVPEGERINVEVGGVSMPIGIVMPTWDSAQVGSYIALCLVHMLGYNAIISATAVSSQQAITVLSGCPRLPADNISDCNLEQWHNHMVWELWTGGNVPVYDAMRAQLKDMSPVMIGYCGVLGTESLFVFERNVDEVYAHSGLPSAYYRTWNASWNDLSPFFSNHADIPEADLMPCRDVNFINMDKYLEFVGDENGTEEAADGRLTAACLGGPNGYWWLSPFCRRDPGKCVPVITGGDGWGIDAFLQKATAYSVPWALAVAANFGAYESVPNRFPMLFYWWEPDLTFVENAPMQMHFPPHDSTAWNRGDKRTAAQSMQTTKWVHARFRSIAGRVYDLFEQMVLPLAKINEVLLDMKMNQVDAEGAACNWLQSNKNIWKRWIPDERMCESGWGLIDLNMRYQASRNTSYGCYWCEHGRFSEELVDDLGKTHICKVCPFGQMQGGIGVTACVDCPPGMYQAASGASACEACAAGEYGSGARRTACEECPPGSYHNEVGNSECMACPKGTMQPNFGQTECVRCAKSTFAGPGRSTCSPCAGDLTTEESGSDKMEQCVCRAGMYRDGAQAAPANSTCHPCPHGMTCPLGSDESSIPAAAGGKGCPRPAPSRATCVTPLTKAGFMTRIDEPLKVYRCGDLPECPGGHPGTCAPGRDTSKVACGLCRTGTYMRGGECAECGSDGGNVVLIMLVAAVAVAVVLLVGFCANRDMITRSRPVATCFVIMGFTISSMQIMGVFQTLALIWQEPLASALRLVAFLSFDLDIIKVNCLGTFSPFTMYLVRQLIAPSGLVLIYLAILAKKSFASPATQVKIEFANASGTIFQAVFISYATSSVMPFVCYSHPGGNGSSMVNEPAIVCYEDPMHASMMAVGIAAVCFVLAPFMGFVGYGTFNYPKLVNRTLTRTGVDFNAFRFLFIHFTPQTFFYGSVLLARNLLICSVPILIQDDWVAQVALMFSVLLGFLVLQASMQPWRTRLTNTIDSIMSTVTVMLLVCGTMSSDLAGSSESIMLLAGIVLCCLPALTAFALAYHIYLYMAPSPKYDFFVCHHKAEAAAQARYLKILLNEQIHKPVFIDSDNLKDLDTLFDTIRTQVKQLIVYLTKNTLTRPWCAGEMATAFSCRVKVIGVRCSCWDPPTEKQLRNLEDYIDLSGSSLAQFGISLDHVRRSFRHLIDPATHMIHLQSGPCGCQKFHKLVDALVGKGFREFGFAPMRPGMLVISSDPHDNEAIAAVGILCSKINEYVVSRCSTGICNLVDHDPSEEDWLPSVVHSSRALLVLLSSRTCESVPQLRSICGRAAEVIPVLTEGFRFPSEAWYTDTLPGIFPYAEAAATVRLLFRKVAVTLSLNASDAVLEAQAQAVVQRIPRGKQNSGISTTQQSLEGARVREAQAQAVVQRIPRERQNSGVSTTQQCLEAASVREGGTDVPKYAEFTV